MPSKEQKLKTFERYELIFMIIIDWDKNMHLVHFCKRNLTHLKDLEQKDVIQ